MKILKAIVQFFVTFGGLRKQTKKITSFCFNGARGSYISQGQYKQLDKSNGWVFKVEFTGLARTDLCIRIEQAGTLNNWEVAFGTADRKLLVVGEYDNVYRWPFEESARPRMCFSGQGRCNNRLTGKFIVREIKVFRGFIRSFAADFVQYDEERQTAWTRGCIRYNSSVEVDSDFLGEEDDPYRGVDIKIPIPTQQDLYDGGILQ